MNFSALELREIRVFLVLAEELHYGRTADRLSLTSSRVSQIIRTLETRVGGRLFDRNSRHVKLTPLGSQLRTAMAPSYQRLERAFNDAREVATGIAGTLRIGMYAPPLLGGPDWVTIIRTFTKRYPTCALELIDTGLERALFDWLRAGDADLLVLRLPATEPDITIGPTLSREPRVVLVSDRDPLAHRDSISYEELADREISDVPTLPREMMDAFIPPTSPSGKTLRRIANRSMEEALIRVAAGMQVHPTVPTIVEHYRLSGIVAIPINDLPPSETALAWLTGNYTQKIAAFAEAASDALARPSKTRRTITSGARAHPKAHPRKQGADAEETGD